MKVINLIILTLLLYSCGSATLAPSDVRRVQYIEKTNLSKDLNYVKALQYISKNFGDSNHAIKAKDKSSGMIMVRGNISCNVFRQFGDVNKYLLQFNMTINTKNKKIRLVFDDLLIIDRVGTQVKWGYNQITSKSKVDKSKGCLEPIRSGIKAELRSDKGW